MASIGPITIMTRIGLPGAPPVLLAGQLAYNQQNIGTPTIPGDILYIGDGQNVTELVGRNRQVELWGDQTITGVKTIDIADFKLTGGENQWLLQTDGQGNLSFTNAPGGGLTQVATDNTTLHGDGTTADPLLVVPETVAVAIDGATLTGDGTALHPLAVNADSVAVATDGLTLHGNGTAGAPLSVVADTVAVAANAPLTGNGTAASPLGLALVTNNTLTGTGVTGSPLGVVGATVAVATDGLTVTGNGTAAFPLQATSGTLAVAVDGTTIGGEGITGNPLHVLPDSVAVAANAPLTGNGTTASPLGLATPLALQYGGTGVSAASNPQLLADLGAASTASLAGYLALAGGTMTGALVLAGNATANLQPTTLQQMTSAISAAVAPYVPLAGATMIGLLVLSGNASANLNPVPLQQLTSTVAAYLPLAGGTLTGPIVLSGNASANLNPVPLQQLTSTLGAYAPIASPTFTGTVTIPASANIAQPNIAQPNIAGVTVNSNAAAGQVGEFMVFQNPGGPVGSGWTTAGGITLTPGDWDVWGWAAFGATGGGLMNACYAGFGTQAAGTSPGFLINITTSSPIMGVWAGAMPTQRFSVNVSTPLNIGCSAVQSGGTGINFSGYLMARRVR